MSKRTPLAVISRALNSEERARAVLRDLMGAGYTVVPRQATPHMIEEAWASVHDENASLTWRDMVAAWEAEVKQEGEIRGQ